MSDDTTGDRRERKPLPLQDAALRADIADLIADGLECPTRKAARIIEVVRRHDFPPTMNGAGRTFFYNCRAYPPLRPRRGA